YGRGACHGTGVLSFPAQDDRRDRSVTGVQTCALRISGARVTGACPRTWWGFTARRWEGPGAGAGSSSGTSTRTSSRAATGARSATTWASTATGTPARVASRPSPSTGTRPPPWPAWTRPGRGGARAWLGTGPGALSTRGRSAYSRGTGRRWALLGREGFAQATEDQQAGSNLGSLDQRRVLVVEHLLERPERDAN